MSEISERIRDVIRLGLAPALRTAGYKRSGTTFTLVRPEATCVTNVQSSAGNGTTRGLFTINLGVYYPRLEALATRARTPDKPKEAECHARARIGALMPGGNDHWWPILTDTDTNQLAKVVREAWEAHAVPWLESRADPVSACRAAERAGEHAFACKLALALGDTAGATTFLLRAIEQAHPQYAEHLRKFGRTHRLLVT